MRHKPTYQYELRLRRGAHVSVNQIQILNEIKANRKTINNIHHITIAYSIYKFIINSPNSYRDTGDRDSISNGIRSNQGTGG